MKKSRGNILFLIFLSIVLFAALAAAVTNSLRGGGNNSSREKADGELSLLLNWFGTVDTAVQRMMMTYEVHMIDFYSPNNIKYDYSGGYSFNNTNCTTPQCEVFSPLGGAVIERSFTDLIGPAETYTSTTAQGYPEYIVMNIKDVGTPLNDVVIRMRGMRKELCMALNRSLGIAESSSSGSDSGGSRIDFSGDTISDLAASNPYVIGNDNPVGRGQRMFCSLGATSATLYFVVIPR